MNKIEEVNILENKPIASDVWQMTLAYTFDTKPGQFVNLYLNSRELLLPRPISICRHDKNILTLVYGVVGKGTKELTSYGTNMKIKVSSPLGNGFDIDGIRGGDSVMVIGGGIGIPPLLELSRILETKNAKIKAVLGFKDDTFLTDEFPGEVYIATETGVKGFTGNVLELIKDKNVEADHYFACGPRPMLKALTNYFDGDIQISMEERMGCGYGACLGCTCRITEMGITENKKVCQDGPVFWGRNVYWNES